MAALVAVSGRAAEALDEEFAESPLGLRELVGGIHRAEEVIGFHAAIERGHESRETVFADRVVNLKLIHGCFSIGPITSRRPRDIF